MKKYDKREKEIIADIKRLIIEAGGGRREYEAITNILVNFTRDYKEGQDG